MDDMMQAAGDIQDGTERLQQIKKLCEIVDQFEEFKADFKNSGSQIIENKNKINQSKFFEFHLKARLKNLFSFHHILSELKKDPKLWQTQADVEDKQLEAKMQYKERKDEYLRLTEKASELYTVFSNVETLLSDSDKLEKFRKMNEDSVLPKPKNQQQSYCDDEFAKLYSTQAEAEIAIREKNADIEKKLVELERLRFQVECQDIMETKHVKELAAMKALGDLMETKCKRNMEVDNSSKGIEVQCFEKLLESDEMES